MKINSEQEMLAFGQNFASSLLQEQNSPSPGNFPTENRNSHPNLAAATVIELVGDVGTGKTTFTRGLATGLGINTPVTSPSFTISKSYALPNGGQLVHYDFYRLPDPGLMTEDLAEALTHPQNVVVIEWGESIASILPPGHTTIHINYTDDGSREITGTDGTGTNTSTVPTTPQEATS